VDFWGKSCWWFPHHARLLPIGCQQTRRVRPGIAVVVRSEAISWTRWPKHRTRNQRVRKQAVCAVVTGPLWFSATGWNISGDSLAPQLIINRCFPHGRHRKDASAGPASTWCVHTVDRCGDRCGDLWALLVGFEAHTVVSTAAVITRARQTP
jgi:hypothetical protein